jgi:hypothetical protein
VPTTSGSEDEDPAALARAYNHSIYLMVGMPYLLLGGVGFLIYRAARLRSGARHPLPADDPAAAPDDSGDRSCPPPSAAGAS